MPKKSLSRDLGLLPRFVVQMCRSRPACFTCRQQCDLIEVLSALGSAMGIFHRIRMMVMTRSNYETNFRSASVRGCLDGVLFDERKIWKTLDVQHCSYDIFPIIECAFRYCLTLIFSYPHIPIWHNQLSLQPPMTRNGHNLLVGVSELKV